MLENKEKWMTTEQLEKEKNILSMLNDPQMNGTQKAKELGYKRTTINLDGKKRSGWVDQAMDLALSVKNLVESRKKYPMGFDFYYWGNEVFKSNMIDKLKSNRIDEKEFFETFPKACKKCLGSGWDRKNNRECPHCKN
jgi:hypothetical protein